MIAIFGASSDIGKRTAARLLDSGHRVRLIAKDPLSLDRRAERVIGDAAHAAEVTRDVSVVISCAHARHTDALLAGLAPSVTRVVLTGSAWRYSAIFDERADEVRSAEAAFRISGRNGVMLHPTMIYGGTQENNLRRLFAAIRRSPIMPLPGGGNHSVQPIYVDDMVSSLVSAAQRDWNGPTLISVAGPRPFPWRVMIEECMAAAELRRLTFPVPLAPAIAVLKLAEKAGLPLPIESGVLERFRENTNVSISAMQSELGVTPREFSVGVREALANWTSAEQFGEIARA